MKKTFTLLAMVLGLSTIGNTQAYNIVTGTVTDCMGAPVVGHPVYVSTDSTTGIFYYHTSYTNALGVYTDTVPYNTFLGGIQPIYTGTSDIAPGTGYYYNTATPTSSGNTYTYNYSINCATPATCSVGFYSWEDSTGINDTTYLVLSLSTSSPAATTVTWDFGDGTFATGTTVNHVYAVNGVYTVCVTVFDASDSCTATFCDSVSDVFRSGFVLSTTYSGAPIGTSVNEISTLKEVKIYPNPAQGELFISAANLSDAKTIIIYDIAGRPVSVTNNTNVANNTRLDISGIENGSYIVVLADASNRPLYTHTLIKH